MANSYSEATIMPILAACANYEAYEIEIGTSTWSMHEKIEQAVSLFLLKNRERIIGLRPFPVALYQETNHRRLLIGTFDKLQAIYKAKVKALLRVKDRVDHLRRSARALKAYKSRKLARHAMYHMLEDVLGELKRKGFKEQEMLKDVSGVAMEIVKLGRFG